MAQLVHCITKFNTSLNNDQLPPGSCYVVISKKNSLSWLWYYSFIIK